jgi:hypothetical protein
MAYVPDEPYGSLPEERQDVFWEIPGADPRFFDNETELRTAETLYAIGFGYTAVEYDAMGLDRDAVHNAREQFFDFMGLEWDDFPWDEWREAMGYE